MNKYIITFILLSIISCSKKEAVIEDIPFSFEKNNAQPNLVSSNGNLSLSWISSKEKNKPILHISHYKNGEWMKPQTIAKGSDWFVNWADFPAHAINEDLIITSYLKKSASGTYTYDVVLSLQDLSGKKIKDDFLLNTDGVKAEHGFVSIIPSTNKGFFITWLDGRNTIEKKMNGDHKPMTIRFAEITNNGPVVVYRDRSEKEVRDIYIVRNINGVWTTPFSIHNDGWIINGCPVNGPKVVANSSNLAVAWFTVVNTNPIVNISFSTSNGDSFGTPLKLNDHDAIGRVDVAFLNKKEVIVSYMEFDEIGTYLKIKKVSIDGVVSKPILITKIDGGRNTGVPQLEIINNEIFIVWTISENGVNQLKSVKLDSKNI